MEKQYKRVISLLNKYRDNNNCIDVGTKELAPTQNSINRVEKSLKVQLPKSYLWFLKNYGYINIFGEEVFYISNSIDVSKIASADIVWNYFIYREDLSIKSYEIIFFKDEFGAIYFMDSSKMDKNGEYSIYTKFDVNGAGEDRFFYANNFLEFLEKQLKDCE